MKIENTTTTALYSGNPLYGLPGVIEASERQGQVQLVTSELLPSRVHNRDTFIAMGLMIDGRPHAIKVYFRGEPIDPQRVLITNQLLANAFSTVWPGVVFSTLDVRRARLHSHQPRGNVRLLLQAEAMSMGCILEST